MLLISPAQSKFGGLYSRYMQLPAPIAIGTLAGFLESRGVVTRVFDE